MQLVFEQIRCGGDRNFGYLLGDREARQAILVDPCTHYEPVHELLVTGDLLFVESRPWCSLALGVLTLPKPPTGDGPPDTMARAV